MVTITSLWLPILLSAVGVWIAGFLMWVVLPHHKNDYAKVSDEEAARNALRGLAPGQYTIPHAKDQSALKDPEFVKKLEQGPAGYLTIIPSAAPNMTKPLVLSFFYYVLVGVVVAYVCGRTLAPGADYLAVFRIAGTVAWAGYGLGIIQEGIWFGRPWSAVVKQVADSLVYGLVTAGMFGWLWPGP